MKYIYHKKCNFCKSSERDLLYKINSQNLVKCRRCGLVFFDKQRSDFEDLYNSDYYFGSKENKAHYTDYNVEEKVAKDNFRFAYDFINKNKSNKKNKLLEVGAGFGFFSKHLPAGIFYEANEVSKEGTKIMRDSGIKVYKGDFLKVRTEKKYDFISSFDVIEHPNFLLEYMIKVRSLLKDNGAFLFTTPDFDTVFNKVFGKTAPVILPLYHNYYLDKKWIKKNMPKIGFKVYFLKTVYTSKMSIGYLLLEASLAFPVIRKLRLTELVHVLRIDRIVVPFFRFGGIQCILLKTGKYYEKKS